MQAAVLSLAAAGKFTLWGAVLADVGSAIIVMLNGSTLLRDGSKKSSNHSHQHNSQCSHSRGDSSKSSHEHSSHCSHSHGKPSCCSHPKPASCSDSSQGDAQQTATAGSQGCCDSKKGCGSKDAAHRHHDATHGHTHADCSSTRVHQHDSAHGGHKHTPCSSSKPGCGRPAADAHKVCCKSEGSTSHHQHAHSHSHGDSPHTGHGKPHAGCSSAEQPSCNENADQPAGSCCSSKHASKETSRGCKTAHAHSHHNQTAGHAHQSSSSAAHAEHSGCAHGHKTDAGHTQAHSINPFAVASSHAEAKHSCCGHGHKAAQPHMHTAPGTS